jgi:hypothetical protein
MSDVMLSELLASVQRRFARMQAPPRLTRANIRTAYALAVTVDIAQFLFGPLGWAGLDEVLDAVAMIAMTRLLGFHPLFLPTFVLEFVPFTDMLPTWTGCVMLVVRARRRQGYVSGDSEPAIDVKASRIE